MAGGIFKGLAELGFRRDARIPVKELPQFGEGFSGCFGALLDERFIIQLACKPSLPDLDVGMVKVPIRVTAFFAFFALGFAFTISAKRRRAWPNTTDG
jgi:hypothetical protein